MTFLPRSGVPGLGETDAEGKYTLKTAAFEGIPPGDYKVAVSYLVSADGKPQGIGPRSASVQSATLISATERLPPEYADLGRTTMIVKVPLDGGSHDFDIQTTVEQPAAKSSDEPVEQPAATKPAAEVDEKTPGTKAPPESDNKK